MASRSLSPRTGPPAVPVASAYPGDISLYFRDTPALAVPAYLTPFMDPTWGTRVTRITNVVNSVPTVAKRQAWNLSETKIFVGLVSGSRVLMNASDYSVINANVGGDGQWWNDTQLVRANKAAGTVFLYNPSTNHNDGTIRNFATYADATDFDFMTQSSPDDGNRYWLMKGRVSGAQRKIWIWDRVLDVMIPSGGLNVTTMPHSGSVSHSGLYYHVNWDANGTGDENGMWIFDNTLTRVFQVDTQKAHVDFGWDTSGDEVLICQPTAHSPSFDPNAYMYRCSDGLKTAILTGQNAYRHGHPSGRNTNRPGWAYFSTYDRLTGTEKGSDMVIAVKLDGSETIEAFAHAHENETSDLVGDSMAIPNRDGTKVIFHSAWGVLNTSYTYLAEMI